MALIQHIYSPSETIRFIFKQPFFQKSSSQGAVLCLGGDPLYTRLLGWKLRLPIYIYSEHYESLWGFKKCFSKKMDGDLMACSIQKNSPSRSELLKKYLLQDQPHYLFFAGSRPQHFKYLFPLLSEAVLLIQKQHPEFSALLLVSPFLNLSIDDIANDPLFHPFKVFNGNDFSDAFQTSTELMRLSELLVTIPGTNTAQALYTHTPMLVLLPLNRPDVLIFDGLLGTLGQLPVIGTLLKHAAVYYLKHKTKLYAQPNRIANKLIVPELIDVLSPQLIYDTILNFVQNPTLLTDQKHAFSQIQPDLELDQKICNCLNNV